MENLGLKRRESVSINPIQSLHICGLSGADLVHHRQDGKFSSGMHVHCPYIQCNFKNSQFQTQGKFPAEFLLNHLHSNHKHRRYDGESLDMTMVVPQVEVMSQSMPSRSVCNPSPSQQATLQTWPFVEIVAHKRYFYLEAQSFNDSEGHPEVFIWLWFFGTVNEEMHFRYSLSVTHGKSEYSYKGPVVSLMKSYVDVKNDGRCLVIREKVWDYMSYKLKITKHH